MSGKDLPGILTNLVFFVSVKSPDECARIKNSLERLGAKLSDTASARRLTHVVSDDDAGMINAIHKQLTTSAWIVTPAWVEECVETLVRAREEDYIPTKDIVADEPHSESAAKPTGEHAATKEHPSAVPTTVIEKPEAGAVAASVATKKPSESEQPKSGAEAVKSIGARKISDEGKKAETSAATEQALAEKSKVSEKEKPADGSSAAPAEHEPSPEILPVKEVSPKPKNRSKTASEPESDETSDEEGVYIEKAAAKAKSEELARKKEGAPVTEKGVEQAEKKAKGKENVDEKEQVSESTAPRKCGRPKKAFKKMISDDLTVGFKEKKKKLIVEDRDEERKEKEKEEEAEEEKEEDEEEKEEEEEEEEVQVRRKRGRPKKKSTKAKEKIAREEEKIEKEVVTRKRGRPKKHVVFDEVKDVKKVPEEKKTHPHKRARVTAEDVIEDDVIEDDIIDDVVIEDEVMEKHVPEKRKPGRPRKKPIESKTTSEPLEEPPQLVKKRKVSEEGKASGLYRAEKAADEPKKKRAKRDESTTATKRDDQVSETEAVPVIAYSPNEMPPGTSEKTIDDRVHTLGGRVRSVITDDVTHFVCWTPKRTMKSTEAVAKGLWVVDCAWLHACTKSHKWIDPSRYELIELMPGARDSRIAHEDKNYKGIFSTRDYKFFIANGTVPDPKKLRRLICVSGGKIASDIAHATICVVRDDAVLSGVPKTAHIVDDLWVVNSIIRHKIQPLPELSHEGTAL